MFLLLCRIKKELSVSFSSETSELATSESSEHLDSIYECDTDLLTPAGCKGPNLYLIYPVIVIVIVIGISAMFNF